MDSIESIGQLKAQQAILNPGSLGQTSGASIHEIAGQFESMFVYSLLKEMRKTIPHNGLAPEMTGKDTYEMLIDLALADEIAKTSSLGVTEFIEKGLDGRIEQLPKERQESGQVSSKVTDPLGIE
jgi:Rod binding domain-containing protein